MEPGATPSLEEQLAAQHAWLRALARRLAGEVDADDLVQETWVAALEAPPEERGRLRPWLASVVRHLASGMRRTRRRRGERELAVARTESLPSAAELVERVDTEQRLACAVLTLEEPFRTTVLLRYREGLSAAEIARRQDVPEGTVRWRCKRGLDELRARLERELGGRGALAIVLTRVIGRTSRDSAASRPLAQTTAAGGGAAMIGTKWMAVGAVVIGTVAATLGVVLSAWSEKEELVKAEAPMSLEALSETEVDERGRGTDERAASRREPIAPSAATRREHVDPGILRVHVIDPDGMPYAGMLAALRVNPAEMNIGELRFQASTIDDLGTVVFPAKGGARELAIERANGFPYVTWIDLEPGDATLEVPAGETLSGRVVVHGEPPQRELTLELTPAWLAAYFVDEPELLATARDQRLFDEWARTRTNDRGEFTFRGLRPDGRYSLIVPPGLAAPGAGKYADPSKPNVFAVGGPRTGLVVELEGQIAVRGRVLAPDGATPASDVAVSAVLTREDGTVVNGYATSDEIGRFEVYTRTRPLAVTLHCERPNGLPDAGDFEFELEDKTNPYDLGDLLLAQGRSVEVRVIDPFGRPIAGARSQSSGPTGPDGRMTIDGLGSRSTSVQVAARGYLPTQVVADAPSAPADVVLRPTNDLEVEVRDREGRPLEGMAMRLRAVDSVFATGRDVATSPVVRADHLGALNGYGGYGIGDGISGWTSMLASSAGSGSETAMTRATFGSDDSRAIDFADFRTDERGRFSVGDLRSDREIELCAIDGTGAILQTRGIRLTPTEHATIQVTLDAAFRRVTGRVVDEEGHPVAGARVFLETSVEPPGRADFTTDARGRFSIERVATTHAKLSIGRRGYRMLDLGDYSFPEDEPVFVLARGLITVVRVVDDEDRPIAGGRLFLQAGEQAGWRDVEAVSDGCFELSGLGTDACRIRFSVPGGSFEDPLDPRQQEHVLRIPVLGALQASWNLGSTDAPRERMVLRLVPRGGNAPAHEESVLSRPQGEHLFEWVVPGDYELSILREANGETVPFAEPIPILPGALTRVEIEPRQ